MPAPRQHIKPLEGLLMTGVAGMFDLVRFIFALTIFIPVVGMAGEFVAWVIGSFADLWFILWFISLQVPFTGKKVSKRAFAFLGSVFAGFIPFVNFLPVVTLAVAYTIRDVRKTDKEALAKWQKEQEILNRQEVRATAIQRHAATVNQDSENRAAA